MGRSIPFAITGLCIDCGRPHDRHHATYRCRMCHYGMAKLRARALSKVADAIKCGRLEKATKLLCFFCEKPARVYDHRDYRKALDVTPVCHPCNQMRGPAVWREYTEPDSYTYTMALRKVIRKHQVIA